MKNTSKKKNVTLIGMPGAGKSTTGVVLAKTIGFQFVDTDLLIQAVKDTTLQDIINTQGIQKFLQIENEVVRDLKTEQSVIAPGGSVIFGAEAMKNLQENSTIIYIQLSVKTIKNRLDNIQTRGIAMGQGCTIDDVYRERVPLYEKYADIIIPAENMELEEAVQSITEALKNEGFSFK